MNTIVYYTKTHNTERFIGKVLQQKQVKTIQITKENKDSLIVNEPYVLLTPTLGVGNIPPEVNEFLNNNERKYLLGVFGSGNKNWGVNFGKAADLIAERHNTKLIGKYEISGKQADVDLLITYMEGLDE